MENKHVEKNKTKVCSRLNAPSADINLCNLFAKSALGISYEVTKPQDFELSPQQISNSHVTKSKQVVLSIHIFAFVVIHELAYSNICLIILCQCMHACFQLGLKIIPIFPPRTQCFLPITAAAAVILLKYCPHHRGYRGDGGFTAVINTDFF